MEIVFEDNLNFLTAKDKWMKNMIQNNQSAAKSGKFLFK